ncbi:MAG: MarR family transcriptional regulator [Candidatus Eisenbacteria bacterium]|nr:MarR family transcriptional regulator [Candidatus Eisenbacteria bacterium]
MRATEEQAAVRKAAARLAELLGASKSEVRLRPDRRVPGADAVIEVAGATFVVEFKASAGAALISIAIEQVKRYASALGRRAVPLVVVPFMGPTGRRRCEEAQVAWCDLSGNARIVAPGIRVLIEGQPNQFKSRGRPSSAFAPKSARIARWLLMHPGQPASQREIAQATGMDEGFTSRIVSRLEEAELLAREPDGGIRLRDPDLLLDAWREDYDFSKHHIFRGHMAARSGEEALHLLSDGLRVHGTEHAATGLAAAWLLTKLVSFRLVTIYVAELPAPKVLERLGLREEARGANVWLAVPKDEGVFQGSREIEQVGCVHPVQAYLDLKDQPERAKEAAERLRAEFLKWSANA